LFDATIGTFAKVGLRKITVAGIPDTLAIKLSKMDGVLVLLLHKNTPTWGKNVIGLL